MSASQHQCSCLSSVMRSPPVYRQLGGSPPFRMTPSRIMQQRAASAKMEARHPSWFRLQHNIKSDTAAAAAVSAQAAAILSTPLWLHAAQRACSVVAAWITAVTLPRWLVTNADKLEAGEVSTGTSRLGTCHHKCNTLSCLSFLPGSNNWHCRS